jgi:hypothetical protein
MSLLGAPAETRIGIGNAYSRSLYHAAPGPRLEPALARRCSFARCVRGLECVPGGLSQRSRRTVQKCKTLTCSQHSWRSRRLWYRHLQRPYTIAITATGDHHNSGADQRSRSLLQLCSAEPSAAHTN